MKLFFPTFYDLGSSEEIRNFLSFREKSGNSLIYCHVVQASGYFLGSVSILHFPIFWITVDKTKII